MGFRLHPVCSDMSLSFHPGEGPHTKWYFKEINVAMVVGTECFQEASVRGAADQVYGVRA